MEVEVLYTIPSHSLPLQSSHYQKSITVKIPELQAKKISYHFYFPQTGNFDHFPVNVSIN